ncbi:MAG: hypothetical protein MUF45_05780 [Spirosomaceae bacterium]|jgi:hypothetical protein|nr:hypothetical protein [Spirosomataceae bacterium]
MITAKDFKTFEALKKFICEDCQKPIITSDNFNDTLQTGDILLFSGQSSLSWRIKLFTPKQGKYRTIWNHVGMVLKLENPEIQTEDDNPFRLKAPNFFLIESIGIGVRLIPLELTTGNYDAKKGYNGNILVARHQELADKNAAKKQLKEIFDFAISHINTPFDNLDITKWAIRAIIRKLPIIPYRSFYHLSSNPPFVCTELVYHSYGAAKIKLHNTPGMITAEDIWRDTKLSPIGVLE